MQSFEPIYKRRHLTGVFQKVSNQCDRRYDQEPVLHGESPASCPSSAATHTRKLSLFGFLKKCVLIKTTRYLK